MFYTYVLRSRKNQKLYYGYTNNLEKRIVEHDSGKDDFTRHNGPWDLVYFEEFTLKTEALKQERFFKSGKGREYVRGKLNNFQIGE